MAQNSKNGDSQVNHCAKLEADHEPEEELEEEEPSVLKILVEKEEDVKQTISLLKEGIAVVSNQTSSKAQTPKKMEANQFQGLNNFLADNAVKSIISSIAGERTRSIIDSAVEDMNSKNTAADKEVVLTNSIEKLYHNIRGNNLNNMNDPRLTFALGMLGLKKDRLI